MIINLTQAQDDPNLRIFRMLEGIFFSLDEAHVIMCLFLRAQRTNCGLLNDAKRGPGSYFM